MEHLIVAVNNQEQKLTNLSYAFIDYIDYKKDGKKFENFIKQREERYVKQKTVRKSPDGK